MTRHIETIKHDITTADAEFNTPRKETDFKEDGIGIDPADCGCTDCIVGHSIPFNDSNSRKIAILAFQVQHQGRKFYPRLGDGVTLHVFSHNFDYGFTAITE